MVDNGFDTPVGCECGDCKRCKNRLRAARWREANRERVDAYNNDPAVRERKYKTSRAWKEQNPERVSEYSKEYKQRSDVRQKIAEQCRVDRQTPGLREKIRARETARDAIKRGKMTRRPCVECGAPETEAHHEDYSRPLDVTFLCRACHLALHQSARQDSNLRPSA